MGEALWWALDSRLRDPQAPPLELLPLGSGQAAVGGGQVAVALSRAEFEALVTRELQLVAYNRPQHADDFRIACSCATVSQAPRQPS